MSVLMANYRVRDFNRFKSVFDEFEPVRAEYGVTDHQLLRDADDPNKVVVMIALPSPDAARRFSSEPRRTEALARAGVVASSDTILEQVES